MPTSLAHPHKSEERPKGAYIGSTAALNFGQPIADSVENKSWATEGIDAVDCDIKSESDNVPGGEDKDDVLSGS